MRTRGHGMTIRMSDEEYNEFKQRVRDSGLTEQSYVLSAVLDKEITPDTAVQELRNANVALNDLDRQMRGIATNVNQMAKVANSEGRLPTTWQLSALDEDVSKLRSEIKKEMKVLWQYLNRLNTPHKTTGD